MSEIERAGVALPAEVAPAFEHDGHAFQLRGDRIVRDGREACVLVSPGFGAGFVTWCDGVSPFEPKIVALVLAGQQHLLAAADPQQVAEMLGAEHVCLLGVWNLEIAYVPLGTQFRIDEYDGSESLIFVSDLPYQA